MPFARCGDGDLDLLLWESEASDLLPWDRSTSAGVSERRRLGGLRLSLCLSPTLLAVR